ncbi:MAG: periplasmic sensor signal transduction histidine kinase [Symbiobacteriaceae bacterium]|jgi:signal transduction histidine kinase|nr:periplasmic sensor signal transduction histidine kinase [Symbiobacteriaceae bacterium]
MPNYAQLNRTLRYPLLCFLTLSHVVYLVMGRHALPSGLLWGVGIAGFYVILSMLLRSSARGRQLPVWQRTLWVYVDFALWYAVYPPSPAGQTGTFTELILVADAAMIGWPYFRGLLHILPMILTLVAGPLIAADGAWSLNLSAWLFVTMPAILFFYLVVYMATRLSEAQVRATQAHAELALAHRQLQEYATQVEAAAVLRERNRLAREVHDSIAHGFTSILMQAELLEKLQGRSPAEAAQTAALLKQQVRESLEEVRRAVHALRPLEADERQGLQGLTELVAHLRQRTAISIDLTVSGTPLALPASHDLCLFRAVQEGVSNAIRHGHASSVVVHLDYRPAQVLLRIVDDGTAAPNEAGQGLGIVGIRERAAVLGGQVQAGPAPDGGFLLQLSLPLEVKA